MCARARRSLEIKDSSVFDLGIKLALVCVWPWGDYFQDLTLISWLKW